MPSGVWPGAGHDNNMRQEERVMAVQSNIYAGVAGYVGRPDEKGAVGVFRRAAAGGEWQHVLKDL
jgi:hypothetical protein